MQYWELVKERQGACHGATPADLGADLKKTREALVFVVVVHTKYWYGILT